MDDHRVGDAIRAVRVRRGWRQQDLATAAGVSRATVSRLERGHLGEVALGRIRQVAAALDIRIDLRPRWRAGDLDRLLNARHSAMHEELARLFADLPGWVAQPEVSFSIFGERGVIDVLAWHPGRRAVLVIEIKTDIADVNELMSTLDRKGRLAAKIALERGWRARTVGMWLVVAASDANRRRVAAHCAVLGSLLPDDGTRVRAWLRNPTSACRALTFWTPNSHRLYAGGSRPATHSRIANERRRNANAGFAARRRVRSRSRSMA
ncbi:MAG TPA: helix-turn-helix domain-containing protein [Candidatus Limnocylindrales bacterium]|jgi:transcriptional regulator with XRE-family HTH domain